MQNSHSEALGCARSSSACERKVESGLASLGVESFVPWHGVRRRWSGPHENCRAELFPGTYFADPNFQRLPILTLAACNGCQFQSLPASIPDSEISLLRRAIESNAPLSRAVLKPAREFAITEGALPASKELWFAIRRRCA